MKILMSVFVVLGSLSAMAATTVNDQVIYDSLNVAEMPLPTPYPMVGYQKVAGRLNCLHMINTQTHAESYTCNLHDPSQPE